MALVNAGEVPRGLQDLAVFPIDAAGVVQDGTDVPGPRSLSFKIESGSDTLEGGNSTIAISRDNKKVTGSVEFGKMNLTAFGVFTGQDATTTGVTPNQITALEEAGAAPTEYVQIVGQAPSRDASGSGYRVTIYDALVTSGPDETLAQAAWSTPTIDFEGKENADGMLLKRENFETMVDIDLTPA